MIALWIIYGVIAVLVPIVAVTLDCPDPDPMIFAFGCFFGVLWPIYAPFALLWFIAKGIGNLVSRI